MGDCLSYGWLIEIIMELTSRKLNDSLLLVVLYNNLYNSQSLWNSSSVQSRVSQGSKFGTTNI